MNQISKCNLLLLVVLDFPVPNTFSEVTIKVSKCTFLEQSDFRFQNTILTFRIDFISIVAIVYAWIQHKIKVSTDNAITKSILFFRC